MPSARRSRSSGATASDRPAYDTDTASGLPRITRVVRVNGAPGAELHRPVRERANPDLGAGEVLQDRDRDRQRLGEAPEPLDGLQVLRRGSMREVEPGHVHPRLEERPQRVLSKGGGANRGDDLRPPVSALVETLDHGNRALTAA